MHLSLRGFALALFSLVAAMPAWASTSQGGQTWVTRAGGEADKGASIWLIRRHIDSRARVRVVLPDAALTEGVAFDVPEADYRRTHNATTFESLVRAFEVGNVTVRQLGRILHDIEINAWRPKQHAESTVLELSMRQIADRFPNGHVEQECFVRFFDEVYTWLQKAHSRSQQPIPIPAACNAVRPSL